MPRISTSAEAGRPAGRPPSHPRRAIASGRQAAPSRQPAATAAGAARRLDQRGKAFPGGAASHKGGAAREARAVPDRLAIWLAASRAAITRLRTTGGRYDLQAYIAGLLRDPATGRGPAVSGCGTPAWGASTVGITYDPSRQRAGVRRIVRCGSSWLCPNCAMAKAVARAEKAAMVTQAVINGRDGWRGQVWFMTLTAHHHLGTRLAEMKTHQVDGFRKVISGREWLRIKNDGGIIGQLKAIEPPWSPETGWHAHLHVLVLFDHRDAGRAERACKEIVERWCDQMELRELKASREAQDYRQCKSAKEAANYVAKGAMEMAMGLNKKSKKGISVSPLVLAEMARHGDKEARSRFVEYSQCMPGTQQLVVPRKLQDFLGIDLRDENESQEEAIESDDGAQEVGCVSTLDWKMMRQHRLVGSFMELVEETFHDGRTWQSNIEPWLVRWRSIWDEC